MMKFRKTEANIMVIDREQRAYSIQVTVYIPEDQEGDLWVDGHTLMVHRFVSYSGLLSKDKWTASDWETGFAITEGSTKESAIKAARARIKNNMDKFIRVKNEAISRFGELNKEGE